MTTAAQLISKLGAVGIKLWLDEQQQLRFKAPKGSLTTSLKDQLLANKSDIIAFLLEAQGNQLTSDIIRLDRHHDSEFALSFAQKRLWFLDRLEPGNPSLHIPASYKINGPLDINILREALTILSARHESLRTYFVSNDQQNIYQKLAQHKPWLLNEDYDLSSLDQTEQMQRIEEIIADEALRPFALNQSDSDPTPLLRTRLARLSPQTAAHPEYILLLTIHHIIADGWSISILINDLTKIYQSLISGQKIDLEKITTHYIDYATWQLQWINSDFIQKQMDYWKVQLDDINPLELATDFQRPKQIGYHGSSIDFCFGDDTSQQLRTLAKKQNTSIFIVLLTTFKILLYKHTQQPDICIGTPVAGRNRQDIENTIGCFINLLAIRDRINPEMTFIDLLAQVQQTLLSAQENQDIPFESVVEALAKPDNLSYTPFFQVLFTLQNNSLDTNLTIDDLSIEMISQQSYTTKYDIQLHIDETTDNLQATIEYNTDLFLAETIKDLSRHLCNLAKAVCKNSNIILKKLDIFDEKDFNQLICKKEKKQQPLTINELLEIQAQQTPNNIAIRCGNQYVNYQQLHYKANALARLLIQQGATPNKKIGIHLDTGLDLMIALLATIKTGACYVPLDTNYPTDRLHYMATNAELTIIITSTNLQDNIKQCSPLLLIDQIDLKPLSTPPAVEISSDNLFYMIYTSGSTGLPKGVCITNENEINLLQWYIKEYSIVDDDKVLIISSFGFDLTQKNLLSPLLTGAEIVFNEKLFYHPQTILKTIYDKKISLINCAPSTFYPIVEASTDNHRIHYLESLRHVLFGGEPILLENLQVWLASDYCHSRITNMYGPTECTDITTTYTLPSAIDYIGKSIPIGQAIDGVETYILDEERNLVPIGKAGELYIAGSSVGKGYFNQQDLNQESFLKNPFSAGLMYRTKDLVKYVRSDKGLQIEFLGRIDDQVKIRGFRVELGEISSRLMLHSNIREAITINDNESQQLIAYLIAQNQHESIDRMDIRSHLKSHIPDYMIPSIFVSIEEWPLSANGKIDKAALPKPSDTDFVHNQYIAARNITESQLCKLWQQILKIDTVGVHDHFFELGGHSLTAIHLIDQIKKEFGVDIPLKDFFQQATIEQLAHRIDIGADLYTLSDSPSIKPYDRNKPLALSLPQERLWIIEQLNPGNNAYNIPLALRLEGQLNKQQLARALYDIVQRHEALRTTFNNLSGTAEQQINEARAFSLQHIDLSQEPSPLIAAQHHFNNEAKVTFNIETDLLFRAQLLILSETDHILVANMHHIISDGWSITILQKELTTLYQAYQNDLPSPLVELPFQYADFSQWQREYLTQEQTQQHLDYWLDKLSDAPAMIHLPTDRNRPKQQTFNGAIVSERFDKAFSQTIKQFTQVQGSTLFNILMSVYALLLSKYSHQDDFCIGTPVAGRPTPELNNLIGYFVNTVVLRQDLSGNPSFSDLLERIQDIALGAFAHQDIPIEKILEQLPLERNLSYPPIAQVGFSFISKAFTHTINIDQLKVTTLDFEHIVAKYDLSLILLETADHFDIHIEYNTDLFDAQTIEKMLQHYRYLLEQIIEAPNIPINSIDLLTTAELYQAIGVNPDQVEKILPLTPMQYDIVLSQLMAPTSKANTLGYRAELDFEVDPDIWLTALQCVAEKQSITRTHFRENKLHYGEFAYQCIFKQLAIDFQIIDYRTEELDKTEIDDRVNHFIYQPENYTKQRFIRYGLMQLADKRTILLLSSHHALLDGISIATIAQQTVAYYQALYQKKDFQDIDLIPDIFSDFIDNNRHTIDNKQTHQFWQDKLKACKALDFTSDQLNNFNAEQIVKQREISPEQWKQLKSYCRKNKISPVHFFKLLYSLLISIYCRADSDFYISEFNAGRKKPFTTSLGCYFQQTPFIFTTDLLAKETKISDLFDYLRLYQKTIKPFKEISVGLTYKISQLGRIHFMYNYYDFFPQNQKMLEQPITCIEMPPFIEGTVQLVVKEHENNASLDLYYQDNCFQDFDFLERLYFLAEQIINSTEYIADLSLLSNKESIQQCQEWNHPEIINSQHHSIQALFENQASNNPNATAIIDDQESITYQSLNKQANQLAHYLKHHGVGSDIRIAICMDKSINVMIAILGIIKAGGVYIPIDTSYPKQRIDYILASAQVHIVITETYLSNKFIDYQDDIIYLDDKTSNCYQAISQSSDNNLPLQTDENDMLYIIFTSGSTGKPKGTIITHKGEINLLEWYLRTFNFSPASIHLVVSSLGFDLTQKNLFAPLLSGGTLILPTLKHYDSNRIHHLIQQYQVNTINCAPSAFYPLIEDHHDYQPLNTLQTVIFGGENIAIARLSNWLETSDCQATIINSYGPSECTDIASFFVLDNALDYKNKIAPIGKPNTNVQIYILNQHQQLLPTGLIGEICIAGTGVGHGYLNHDELTAKKFIPNPFGSGQLYLSGDLGRYDNNGNIQFIRREDDQVKINGIRIELGEIEQAIRQQAGVTDALVIVNQDQLIAYAIGNKMLIDCDSWETNLAQHLPRNMIPDTYIVLDQWPLTSNGKIDRQALPAAKKHNHDVAYFPPRDDVEEVICTIVRQILGLQQVGIYDDFFRLGGHSLAASRAIIQIREHFKIEIPVSILFEMTTPEKLASYIKASQWAHASSKQHDDNNDRDVGFI